MRGSTKNIMGTTGNKALKIEPVGFHHIIGWKGFASIETPVTDLISKPFCPVCCQWGGLRSSNEVLITLHKRADVLNARAAEIRGTSISLYSPRLTNAVLNSAPRMVPIFKRASDRDGGMWWELLAPAQVLFCGIRTAEVPEASRCGRCGSIGAYCPDMKYVGTFFAVPEEDFPRDTLFYSAQFFLNSPPKLIATGEGVKLLKSQGCLFDAVKVAILKAADVDRMPNVKIFNEPV